VLALETGIVARDRHPDHFLAVHRGLFAARHDRGEEIGDPGVVRRVLESAGVDPDAVFDEIDKGWPLDMLRSTHEKLVADLEVFGVPTFIVENTAAFVRLMTRPGTDGAKARATIERVVGLLTDHPELNELKHTTIPR